MSVFKFILTEDGKRIKTIFNITTVRVSYTYYSDENCSEDKLYEISAIYLITYKGLLYSSKESFEIRLFCGISFSYHEF